MSTLTYLHLENEDAKYFDVEFKALEDVQILRLRVGVGSEINIFPPLLPSDPDQVNWDWEVVSQKLDQASEAIKEWLKTRLS